jgi:8-oxo-dGTP pyrophosphatase MutT (NUDIX family)
MREHVIERLARYQAGRRGFGGANDPEEAAEFRKVLAADPTLPGMTPPNPALRPAAVLVPLIDHAAGMTVLLTQRTAHLSAHAGQISFPGGRVEDGDADMVTTALRETEEEVGLSPARVNVIGRLDTYLTGTGFEITPIVGIIAPPVQPKIDPFEVAEAFEVPLAYILDRRNHQRVERESGGRRRAFFILPYEGRNIWGATAGILVNLAEVLAE